MWIRIKNPISKHFAFYLLLFIAFIISIAVIEMVAKSYIIKRIKKNAETQKTEYRFNNDEKTIKFINKYADRLHHLRGPSVLISDKSPPSDLLFSVSIPFSKINNQNVLIQGDSWAVAAKYSKTFIKKFGEKEGFGVVLAGVRSYAPSPMTLQLETLRADFSIKPSIIIGIIDQTDIGDELFNYKEQINDTSGSLNSLLPIGRHKKIRSLVIKRNKNITSSNFSIAILLKHALYHFQERVFSRAPSGSDILSPLINGVDISLNQYFSFRLNRYIEKAFDDRSMKKLILVTHPHRNHLVNNDYIKFKGEVGILVNQVVTKSKHKKKIIHIDFLKSDKLNFLNKNIATAFIKNDPFSHLTSKMYSEYYYPFIFSKLQNLK